MQTEKKIEVGIKALIIDNGKFLVMHNNGEDQDLWELPGGRMEFGETAEITVVRELIEETGLTVQPLKILDTWNYVEESYQITGIIYLCYKKEGNIRLSDEHYDYKWLPATLSSVDNMYDAFKERMLHWNWAELNCSIQGKCKKRINSQHIK